MRTALFFFVLTSMQFYATVSAQAQSTGGAASGIDEKCSVNPADPQGDTVLFFTRYGVFIQSSASQVTPDTQVIHGGSGVNSSPFSAEMMFVAGTNSAPTPLMRLGEVVYPFPESNDVIYMTNSDFGTESALAAGFPAGSYSAEYDSDGSIISVPITIPDFNLPTPKISNFDELQSFTLGQAFTIRWLPFVTGNSKGSTITLRLEEIDDYGAPVKTVFLAPNYCTNIVLQPTEGQITVPAGILEPGKNYQGELCFGRTAYGTNATAPSLLFAATDLKQTRFLLGGAVITVPSIAVGPIVPAGDGKFTVTLNVTGVPSVMVETSVDLAYWEYSALMPAGPTGVTTFGFAPLASEGARFYRFRAYY